MQTADESVLWDYINERHRIYLRRATGELKPWTNDPILRQFKFTNVFRELDRGTTWLRENFILPHWDDDPADIIFNCCWYRMFNWWKTGQILGWQTTWDTTKIYQILTLEQAVGRQIFTGAHIVYSRPGLSKIDAIINVCSELYSIRRMLVDECRRNSLELVFNDLLHIDSVGRFMAHEMIQDIRHTRLLENATDINTWTNLGPGAKRGLLRLNLPAANQAQGQQSMVDLYARSLVTLDKHVLDDPRGWELHSIEFCLCEIDKYLRVKFGEGQPRSRYQGV